MIGFQNGREARASHALQLFFLLGNQVVGVFHLKNWLIILGAIPYVVEGGYILQTNKESTRKSLVDHLFKGGSRLEEGVDAHKPEFRPGSMFM